MAEDDHRGDPSGVNEKPDPPLPELPEHALFSRLVAVLLDWFANWFPVPPRIVPGTVMLRKDVIRNLKITEGTFVKWRERGLRTIVEAGARSEIVLTDDLIRFLTSIAEAATA